MPVYMQNIELLGAHTFVLLNRSFSLVHVAVGTFDKVKERVQGTGQVDAVQQGLVHPVLRRCEGCRQSLLLVLQSQSGISAEGPPR